MINGLLIIAGLVILVVLPAMFLMNANRSAHGQEPAKEAPAKPAEAGVAGKTAEPPPKKGVSWWWVGAIWLFRLLLLAGLVWGVWWLNHHWSSVSAMFRAETNVGEQTHVRRSASVHAWRTTDIPAGVGNTSKIEEIEPGTRPQLAAATRSQYDFVCMRKISSDPEGFAPKACTDGSDDYFMLVNKTDQLVEARWYPGSR